jgi:hypothetical protein
MSFDLPYTLWLEENIKRNITPILQLEYDCVKTLEQYITNFEVDRSVIPMLNGIRRSDKIKFEYVDEILKKIKAYGTITPRDATLLYYTYLQNINMKLL